MEDFQTVKTHSIIEERKVIYEWKIDQFRSMMRFSMNAKKNSTIRSPDFSTNNKPGDSSWCLEINLHSDSESPANCFSIALTYCGSHQSLRANYSMWIIDNEKNKQFERKGNYIFDNNVGYNILPPIKMYELYKEINKYLPDDTLTISLELTEFIVRSNTSQPTTKLRLGESKQIVDDLKHLFDSKEGSDVVLIVGDKKIPAHKTLLVSRSPVFSAMFKHKLKENRENEVNIPDMDPDTCEKLLEFIYTDNVTDFDQFFERLYEPADKYQIPALKKVCEELLYKNVKVENAVQYLVLLDRHNAGEEFFKYILDFIAINSKKIIETPEFKALEKTNTELLMTIITKICSIK